MALSALAAVQFAAPSGKSRPVAVVLVIHRQQAVRGGLRSVGQRVVLHAVVMHAGLQRLLRCASWMRRSETPARRRCCRQDRPTRIARWHGNHPAPPACRASTAERGESRATVAAGRAPRTRAVRTWPRWWPPRCPAAPAGAGATTARRLRVPSRWNGSCAWTLPARPAPDACATGTPSASSGSPRSGSSRR